MSDITKAVLDSDYNAFKNDNVHSDTLTIPASVGAGSIYTDTITFTLNEPAVFIMPYVYATKYGEYFIYLDSNYHDMWQRPIQTNDASYLLHTDAGLYFFELRMSLAAEVVTFTMRISRVGFGAITITHPTYQVPVTLIEYTLVE